MMLASPVARWHWSITLCIGGQDPLLNWSSRFVTSVERCCWTHGRTGRSPSSGSPASLSPGPWWARPAYCSSSMGRSNLMVPDPLILHYDSDFLETVDCGCIHANKADFSVCVIGQLGWQDVCVGAVAQCSLWDLAKAIILLYSDTDAKEWTADTVLGIVDEMAGELFGKGGYCRHATHISSQCCIQIHVYKC